MSRAQNAARNDFYGPVHKGLRLKMCGALVRFSSGEFSDEKQCRELLKEMREAIKIAHHHVKTEDTFIHPAIEQRAKDEAVRFIKDHLDHHKVLEELTDLANRLESAAETDRQAVAMKLYHRWGEFVGESLVHMAAEEAILQPLFHKHFSDEELMGIAAKLRAGQAPEMTMAMLGLMIPSINRSDREDLLREIKDTAPAPVFNAIMERAARPNLAPEDWQDLTRRLGVPA